MEEEYKGYFTSTELTSELENGHWKINLVIRQKRLLDSGEWEERSAELKAVDQDRDRAINVASVGLMQYLESIDGDLFNDDGNMEELLN